MRCMEATRKQLRSNIWKFYTFTFFRAFIFAYVTERIFQQARGLSVTEMVYLDIIFFVLVLLLEVPSGALADRWSRKKILMIGVVFVALEFFIPIFAFNFWIFALASVAAAIGVVLQSGTANAFMYDTLKSLKQEKTFEKFLGKEKFLRYTANGVAIVLGGFVAHYISLEATYWFSLIGMPLALILAASMTEPKIHTTTAEVSYWKHIADAGQFIWANKSLRFIVLYGVITGAVLVEIDEYVQLFYQAVGLPIVFFGIVSTTWLLLQGVGGFIAGYLKERIKLNALLLWVLILSILFLFLAIVMKTLLSLIPLVLAFFVMGIMSPLVFGYLHHQTDSKHRATVDSFHSLLLNGISIVIGLGFAYFSDHISIFWGYSFLGALLVVYLVYYIAAQGKLLQEK